MFFDELSPVFKELAQHPVAFFGGFVSGILRINLADDPVKSWLDSQGGTTSVTTPNEVANNGRSSGPQSIAIE